MSDDRGSTMANYHDFTMLLNLYYLYYYYYCRHWSFIKIVLGVIRRHHMIPNSCLLNTKPA